MKWWLTDGAVDLVADGLATVERECEAARSTPRPESMQDRLIRQMQAALATVEPGAVLPLAVSPARALALASGEMYPSSEADRQRLARAGMLVIPDEARY